MMDFDTYWNPYELLPYQRNFMFVNSTRKDGKTYGTQYHFIKRYLKFNEQFVMITRTDGEIKNGVFREAFQKILYEQFPDLTVEFKGNKMYKTESTDKGKFIITDTIGYALALKQTVKRKKESYPRVKWAYMDEYMLEPQDTWQYVNGWKEPDALLNLYHTIDAEEDRVKIFLLGNNTSFYNPYHLHPAFNIPPTKPGKIWTSENVLFQHYVPSQKLREKKSQSKFLRMIDGTQYGNYALQGQYIGDNEEFIATRPNRAQFIFIIKLNDEKYGVWGDNNKCYISNKMIDNCPTIIALSKSDISEDANYKHRQNKLTKFMLDRLLKSAVYYENQTIKAKVKPELEKLI